MMKAHTASSGVWPRFRQRKALVNRLMKQDLGTHNSTLTHYPERHSDASIPGPVIRHRVFSQINLALMREIKSIKKQVEVLQYIMKLPRAPQEWKLTLRFHVTLKHCCNNLINLRPSR